MGPAGCSPPTFSKISEIHADIVFAKVDTEAEPGLSAAARITSIPALMAFREGILVFSQPGAMNAAGLEQLISSISSIKELDMEEVRAEMAAATVSQETTGPTPRSSSQMIAQLRRRETFRSSKPFISASGGAKLARMALDPAVSSRYASSTEALAGRPSGSLLQGYS